MIMSRVKHSNLTHGFRCGVYLCVAEVVLASLTVLNEENGFVLHDKSLLICYYSHEALLSH